MASQAGPPADLAQTVIALTEGDRVWIRLTDGSSFFGTVMQASGHPPNDFYESLGKYELTIESSGVEFTYTMKFSETPDGIPQTESDRFFLTHGREWEIPIGPEVKWLSHR